MTDEIFSKETLQVELDTIKMSTAKEQWRYYYIESIQNFIIHLHTFPSERTQTRIATEIHAYLILLKERINEDHDVHDLAKKLYPAVWKLSREYVDFLGFIKKPSYIFRFVLGAILFFLLKSSFDAWIAVGCVSFIAIATTAYSAFKIKKRKYW
ncbi:MAG: hypothetical protein EOO46_23450 [Flavobacterium sp.]|nr:MAG: hypothetical protein EOO46_23450 [Flavobacterium sp.]